MANHDSDPIIEDRAWMLLGRAQSALADPSPWWSIDAVRAMEDLFVVLINDMHALQSDLAGRSPVLAALLIEVGELTARASGRCTASSDPEFCGAQVGEAAGDLMLAVGRAADAVELYEGVLLLLEGFSQLERRQYDDDELSVELQLHETDVREALSAAAPGLRAVRSRFMAQERVQFKIDMAKAHGERDSGERTSAD